MTRSTLIRSVAAVAGLLAAGGAMAHPGHDAATFASGLAHPVAGLDHLLAMVTVGLWAAIALPAARRWWAPVLFVSTMALAALVAPTGLLPVPAGWLEPALAASVVLLGALMVAARHVGAAFGLALVVGSALLHGTAHGLELAPGASALAFAGGFTLSTAVLHVVGLAAGGRLQRLAGRLRQGAGALLGALVAAAGALMLIARI